MWLSRKTDMANAIAYRITAVLIGLALSLCTIPAAHAQAGNNGAVATPAAPAIAAPAAQPEPAKAPVPATPTPPVMPVPNPQPEKNNDMPTVTIGGPPTGNTEANVNPIPADMPASSLFFSQEEITVIHEAIGIYIRHKLAQNDKEGDDFLSKLGAHPKFTINDKPEKQYYTYPQFFLESLVYNSPSDWSIRVNRQKLTQAMPKADAIHVVAIDKDKVSLEWKPVNMEKVKEVWAHSPNDMVTVDEKQGVVDFSLRANQTFSSRTMRVVEGKMPPIVVEIKPQDNNISPEAGLPLKKNNP